MSFIIVYNYATVIDILHSGCYSSCISNMKNIKGNIYPKKLSVVNTDLCLKVTRVMLMIFSIDLVKWHFKVFLTIYMHQFGWFSERGVNFLNLLQEKGLPWKRRGGGSGLSMNICAQVINRPCKEVFSQIARAIYCLPRVSGQAV